MIEVVFSDGAGGMMKQAQRYGKGSFNEGGAGRIFLCVYNAESVRLRNAVS